MKYEWAVLMSISVCFSQLVCAGNISEIQQIGQFQAVQTVQMGIDHQVYGYQSGVDNRIDISQNSSSNQVYFEQVGTGHSAQVIQNDLDNSLELYQYNAPKSIRIEQSGGETIIITQY